MLALIDARLNEARFIAGDEYPIADITAFVAVDFMRVMRVRRPEGLWNLERWHREVSPRPSASA
jgi:glutathione S-transferase